VAIGDLRVADVHMPRLTYIIESRMTHFQEGEDDEDIPTICNPDAMVTPDASLASLVTNQ
jgi:hypothetical protein